MINIIKKIIIKKIINAQVDKPINNSRSEKFNFLKRGSKYFINSYGDKNKNKIFYVMKVDRIGGGLFSNVLFVLNHLKIAEKLGFIPVVDMENFFTRYNEKNKVNGTNNSWLYYFKQVSKYNLSDVYKSNKVILTENFFPPDMPRNYKEDKDYLRIYKKYIKIHKHFFKQTSNFAKKNFKGQKVLGVHFRGTSMRTITNHPFPPTPEQMINAVDKLISKKKFTKIFIVTDQLKYLEIFKKRYNKMICYCNTFRSNKNKIFHLNPRKNHRYKMGCDAVIEMLLLSKLKTLICSRSNLSQIAVLTSKNKNYKVFELWNGVNSKRILVAQFLWNIKRWLPESLGGFKKKLL